MKRKLFEIYFTLFLDDIFSYYCKATFNGYFIGDTVQRLIIPFNLISTANDAGNNFIFISDYGAYKLIKFDLDFQYIDSVLVEKALYLTASTNAIYVNSNFKAILKYDFNLTENTLN